MNNGISIILTDYKKDDEPPHYVNCIRCQHQYSYNCLICGFPTFV